ncbi:MAG: alpha/beta hydrolase [Clostridia bacterium]|nr:alpha/beta hydrolase [Clostridia bacterium]
MRRGKRLLAALLAALMAATAMVCPAVAMKGTEQPAAPASAPVMTPGIVTDFTAHMIALFTTNQPDQIPGVMTKAIEASPVGGSIGDKYNVEKFKFRSFDGTKLQCYLFHAPDQYKKDGKKRVLIAAHGFQVNHLVPLMYLPLFTKMGFDFLVFDQRSAGASDNAKCTMGYYEALDVVELSKWITQKYGDDVILGLHGESMGGGTVMQASDQIPNLAFLIEDCGYSDLYNLLKTLDHRYLKAIVPEAQFDEFWELANVYSKVGNITYRDVRPVDHLKNMDPDIPALFIHGGNDLYVPTYMVYDNYDAKPGKKDILVVKNAGHSQSHVVGFQAYENKVRDFLSTNGIV